MGIIRNIPICEAEEIMYQQDNFECFILEEDEDHRIVVDSSYIYLGSFGINIHNATWLRYDEDSEDYEADFNMYMFIDSDTNEVIYDEYGSSLETCIYNCYGEYADELLCDLVIIE